MNFAKQLKATSDYTRKKANKKQPTNQSWNYDYETVKSYLMQRCLEQANQPSHNHVLHINLQEIDSHIIAPDHLYNYEIMLYQGNLIDEKANNQRNHCIDLIEELTDDVQGAIEELGLKCKIIETNVTITW